MLNTFIRRLYITSGCFVGHLNLTFVALQCKGNFPEERSFKGGGAEAIPKVNTTKSHNSDICCSIFLTPCCQIHNFPHTPFEKRFTEISI